MTTSSLEQVAYPSEHGAPGKGPVEGRPRRSGTLSLVRLLTVLTILAAILAILAALLLPGFIYARRPMSLGGLMARSQARAEARPPTTRAKRAYPSFGPRTSRSGSMTSFAPPRVD